LNPSNFMRIFRSIIGGLFRKKTSRVGLIIILAIVAFILIGPLFDHFSPYATTIELDRHPSSQHPFGTDFLGHDIMSQVIWGAYPSMFVGIIAASGAAIVGVMVGILAGYYRKMEVVLTPVADILLTFPAFPLLILIGTLFTPTNFLIALSLILVLWPVTARSIRSQTLSIKERPYVVAAKTTGMSNWGIVWREIFPEVVPIAIAYFVLNVALAIVLVTALEFLGVGNPDIVSWGSILYWAQQFAFYSGDWWWIVAPGLSIALVAIGFALIGFSVEEVMNPRLRA
jgi:peptide/nickel transport system permease protein